MAKCLAAILLLACAAAARAEEPVTRFMAAIVVNADASLDVTETIGVDVTGEQVKHGIIRVLNMAPLAGGAAGPGFTVTRVMRDGAAENFVVSPAKGGGAIRIGKADVLLEHGHHDYEIALHVLGAIQFHDSFDGLAWEVTGKAWTLPIDHAAVSVELPTGAEVLHHEELAGDGGPSSVNVTSGEGSFYGSSAAHRLEPGQGFAIAVAFTPGVVQRPAAK